VLADPNASREEKQLAFAYQRAKDAKLSEKARAHAAQLAVDGAMRILDRALRAGWAGPEYAERARAVRARRAVRP
jgi:hypothetical protein